MPRLNHFPEIKGFVIGDKTVYIQNILFNQNAYEFGAMFNGYHSVRFYLRLKTTCALLEREVQNT